MNSSHGLISVVRGCYALSELLRLNVLSHSKRSENEIASELTIITTMSCPLYQVIVLRCAYATSEEMPFKLPTVWYSSEAARQTANAICN